jgi:uncharacterized protein (TIGR02284 family)
MRILFIAAALVPLAGCADYGDDTADNGYHHHHDRYADKERSTTTTTTTTTTAAATPANLTDDQRRDAIDRLNGSTRMLIDASNLYGDAAHLARNPQVKDELTRLSQERGNEAAQFQAQVQAIGGQPVSAGGAGGPWEDGLMRTKSLVQNDSRAAVDQVLDSENGVVSRFNEDLGDGQLDEGTKSFIRATRDANLKDRDELAELKSHLDDRG